MTTEPPERPRRRLGVVDALRWLLVVAVAVAVAFALRSSWPEVSHELSRIPAATLLLALGFWVLAPVATLLGWRALLTDLGSHLHLAPGASLFFVGQLGKYLPGSVWSVLAQAEMGARLGIPRRRSAVVGLLSIGLAVHTGLLVGLPALPYLLDRSGRPGGGPWGHSLAGGREHWDIPRGDLGKSGTRWLPVRRPEAYAGDVFQTLCRAAGLALPAPEVVESLPDGDELARRDIEIDAVQRRRLHFGGGVSLRQSVELDHGLVLVLISQRGSPPSNSIRSICSTSW